MGCTGHHQAEREEEEQQRQQQQQEGDSHMSPKWNKQGENTTTGTENGKQIKG
jgi:hypothetical protein